MSKKTRAIETFLLQLLLSLIYITSLDDNFDGSAMRKVHPVHRVFRFLDVTNFLMAAGFCVSLLFTRREDSTTRLLGFMLSSVHFVVQALVWGFHVVMFLFVINVYTEKNPIFRGVAGALIDDREYHGIALLLVMEILLRIRILVNIIA